MRISDWSSDVCSSDLEGPGTADLAQLQSSLNVLDSVLPTINGQDLGSGLSQLQTGVGALADGARQLSGGVSALVDRNVQLLARAEESRVGKEGVSTGRSRWWPAT